MAHRCAWTTWRKVVNSAENVRLGAWANLKPAIILNVQRQPGANVIATVDAIKERLPELQASLPASLRLDVLSDRTTGIRASVEHVQIELLLAVVLVVLVIFAFLHSIRATVIASLAVPISLIGTFGVMYLLGYSLNNLSLMALTIATGFVVDDAIVMIENIARYIEEGEKPMAAAIKGAAQIGFTIISLTVSLIAVLIPLLFMGDVVGRLFREFAVTLAITILISGLVSLTLVPMMSARWLRSHEEEKPGKWADKTQAFFDRVIHKYDRGLDWVLARQGLTLDCRAGHAGADGPAVGGDPERPVPDPGHGPVAGARRSAPGDFLRPHGRDAAGRRQGHPAGSGSRIAGLERRRRRRQQHHAPRRHHADQPEARPRAATRTRS